MFIVLEIVDYLCTTHALKQDGVTALSMAAQEQHTAVVEALILAGANLDLPNNVRAAHIAM